MKRALVVGGTGFVGRHLARVLAASDREVLATGRRPPLPDGTALPGEVRALDIEDREAVLALVGSFQPDEVYHLAAVSDVPAVFEFPARGAAVNVAGAARVLEAIALECPRARAVVASSGTVYEGADPSLVPWDETVPAAPLTLYAATKVAAEAIAQGFAMERKVQVVVVRPFNQIGPGQSPRFALPSFARQVARIERGLGDAEGTIEVGAIENRRDFCDVRDMARALILAMERGRPGEIYNVASGRPVRVGDLLERMLARSGVRARIVPRSSRLRPQDVPIMAGDASKAARELGWRPETPVEQSLDDCLADWRSRIDREEELRA
ncbi:MAG: GDP-mannose 4,6-dehydratase [Planctomycetes bacterium]|nr:GDP-mannose 4,6-dehydratase [Planctomycetota bacterium]